MYMTCEPLSQLAYVHRHHDPIPQRKQLHTLALTHIVTSIPKHIHPKMLSEKARGKQRALEQDATSEAGPSSSAASSHEPATRQLVIRFAEGAPDLTVSVGKQDTVRDIKRNVCYTSTSSFSTHNAEISAVRSP